MQDSSSKDMSNVDFSVIADSEHVDVYKIERGFLFSLFLTDKGKYFFPPKFSRQLLLM